MMMLWIYRVKMEYDVFNYGIFCGYFGDYYCF